MNSHGSGIEDDVSYTLNCIDRHAVYAKSRRAASSDDYETWNDGEVSNTLNTFDIGDKRATELVVEGCLNPQDVQSKRIFTTDSVAPTLNSGEKEGMNIQPCVLEPICMAPSFSKRPGQQIATTEGGASYALTTGEPPRVLI